ncbi:hypothetical protein [Deinococcus ficus]|uniref:hypothetical protein n=1 Tax=Deinococcus ficus TaxID=317577 RepID=UPI00174C7D00|nr:hypothetical protein [Deinococcus ficus]GHF75614.1 hypothetical protein GCM10017782_11650 [Deinococcus ficus]
MTNEERLALLLEVFEDTLQNLAAGRYTLDFHAETVEALLCEVRQMMDPAPPSQQEALQA